MSPKLAIKIFTYEGFPEIVNSTKICNPNIENGLNRIENGLNWIEIFSILG